MFKLEVMAGDKHDICLSCHATEDVQNLRLGNNLLSVCKPCGLRLASMLSPSLKEAVENLVGIRVDTKFDFGSCSSSVKINSIEQEDDGSITLAISGEYDGRTKRQV